MYKNLLKEKLTKGGNVSGCLIHVPAPALVEILGMVGFDFAFIDCEHSPMTAADCEHLIRAADLCGITPLVRVPKNEQEMILRYMDIGAQGIIVPGVRNKEEAKQAVKATKYYPQGSRGLSVARSSDYGLKMVMKDYVEYANSQTVVFTSMENTDAVNNIEEILNVDGLDGVLFGASDLSQSLGYPGQLNHPVVQAAIEKARISGLKCGKPIGSVVRAGEVPNDYYRVGYRIVLTSIYALLAQSAKDFTKLAKG
jgi:4-hydroxy-2-oxoheptanedioate aldolase